MNKVFLISLSVVLAISVGLVGCEDGELPEEPDAIKIFAARPLSGVSELLGKFAFGPVMNYWMEEVNAAGGIYVAEYDKKLPVEITIQDNESDIGIMALLLTEAINSGDYHFVLPSANVPFIQVAAGICSANKYVLIGFDGGGTAIENTLDMYPYLFSMLNWSTWNQMEKLFEILDDWQTNDGAPNPMNVYIIYVYGNDLYQHGTEYRDAFVAEAASYPGQFNIVKQVPVDVDTLDVTALLEEAVSLNTTLLCSFTYTPTSTETIIDAVDNGYNFDAIIVGPGGCFEYTLLSHGQGNIGVGPENIQGVMSFGAWNEYSSNETTDFAAHLIDDNKDYWAGFWPVDMIRYTVDWWGAAPYYAGLQCLQQAIERAGTLDNDDVRAELAAAWPGSPTNPPFDTVLGDAWFTDTDGNPVDNDEGGLLAQDCYLGQIGQWQKAEAPYWGGNAANPRAKPYGIPNDATEWWIFEVIDLDENQTAQGIYPKPNWPE
jgi:branched-chain amino acid transport system substrate-binding protein